MFFWKEKKKALSIIGCFLCKEIWLVVDYMRPYLHFHVEPNWGLVPFQNQGDQVLTDKNLIIEQGLEHARHDQKVNIAFLLDINICRNLEGQVLVPKR